MKVATICAWTLVGFSLPIVHAMVISTAQLETDVDLSEGTQIVNGSEASTMADSYDRVRVIVENWCELVTWKKSCTWACPRFQCVISCSPKPGRKKVRGKLDWKFGNLDPEYTDWITPEGGRSELPWYNYIPLVEERYCHFAYDDEPGIPPSVATNTTLAPEP